MTIETNNDRRISRESQHLEQLCASATAEDSHGLTDLYECVKLLSNPSLVGAPYLRERFGRHYGRLRDIRDEAEQITEWLTQILTAIG